jgi:hypothetical protein
MGDDVERRLLAVVHVSVKLLPQPGRLHLRGQSLLVGHLSNAHPKPAGGWACCYVSTALGLCTGQLSPADPLQPSVAGQPADADPDHTQQRFESMVHRESLQTQARQISASVGAANGRVK